MFACLRHAQLLLQPRQVFLAVAQLLRENLRSVFRALRLRLRVLVDEDRRQPVGDALRALGIRST
jgi:hypothetical protein